MARTTYTALTFTAALALATFTRATMGAPPGAAPATMGTDDAAVRKAMDDEMARSLAALHAGASAPPYYLRYTVTDTDRATVSARLGALVEDQRRQGRSARVDARVGSPDEDNTNFREAGAGRAAGVTREDDYAALRRDLWLITDAEYKRALETLARKKASRAVQVADEDKVPDFARAAPVQSVKDHAAPLPADARAALQANVLALSRLFRDFPGVNASYVEAEVEIVRRRLLTSEKTWADERRSRIVIEVHADTLARDGQRVASAVSFSSADAGGLPTRDEMAAEVIALAKNLTEQRAAPVVEAGLATVLFEGRAAPQLAKLLLAAPLSGQPVPRAAGDIPPDGSTSLADKLGQPVAPKWLSVVDDPTAPGPGLHGAKRELFGSYDTDDEGVPAERVTLIDKGEVKSLLMSRTPRKEIPRSNGHGRATWAGVRGAAANLFVTATGGLDRRALLAAAVRSAGPKGTVYVVRELGEASGIGRGQTLRARVAFRYKDGKEVVRGLSLEGFSPKKLKKDLIAAGKDAFVRDDEEGGLPVSVVTPALLFEEVDIGKPNDKRRTLPLYPSPLSEAPR